MTVTASIPWYRRKVVLVFGTLGILWWASSQISNAPSVGEPVASTGVGKEVTLMVSSGEVAVAVNEAAYSEFQTLAVANDTRGMAQMALRGQLFLVPSGTRALVIDRGFEKRRVRIINGPMRDRDGWVTASLVK